MSREPFDAPTAGTFAAKELTPELLASLTESIRAARRRALEEPVLLRSAYMLGCTQTRLELLVGDLAGTQAAEEVRRAFQEQLQGAA